MFFNKIFHFVKGYVIIRVMGKNIERFLYICAKRGIKLFSMQNRTDNMIVLCVSISDYFKLRPVGIKTGVYIRIVKKCGLPFIINRIRKRKILLSGVLFVIVVMFLSSQFIWSVEIEGTDEKTVEEIMTALEKTGVHIGAFKPKLIEPEQMKSIILNNTDNLVWAWVHIKGTKATVVYKEGIKAPEITDRASPCDIVSLRDGVIYKITEKNGKKRVEKNEAVLKGDLLIAGTVSDSLGNLKTVHATGDVFAYTWHRKSGEYKLYNEKAVFTGKSKSFKTLKVFSWCFDLFYRYNAGFDDYVVKENLKEIKLGKDNYTGVGLYDKVYYEVIKQKKPLTYETAVEIGKNELEKEISYELTPGAKLVDKTITHEKIDEETVKVTVEMVFIENIAKTVPLG